MLAGDNWQAIDAPTGVRFRAVSAGLAGIWALDNTNRLAVRKDISNVTPQGTHWQFLVNVANIAPHTDTHIGFKAISVSTEVWAIAMNGVICRRCGITKDNPAGSGWNISIPVRLILSFSFNLLLSISLQFCSPFPLYF